MASERISPRKELRGAAIAREQAKRGAGLESLYPIDGSWSHGALRATWGNIAAGWRDAFATWRRVGNEQRAGFALAGHLEALEQARKFGSPYRACDLRALDELVTQLMPDASWSIVDTATGNEWELAR